MIKSAFACALVLVLGCGGSGGSGGDGGNGANGGGAPSGGAGGGGSMGVTVAVQPSITTVLVGKTLQLKATVTGASDGSVTWSVEESNCGTVTAGGKYTAPDEVPDPSSCRVRATSQASPSASGEARLIIAATASGGEPGIWTNQYQLSPLSDAGGAQTVVVDPVRPSDFYAFVSESDTLTTQVMKSTDFGMTWNDVNTTAELHGTPWGAAIDPNPHRDPDKPPTLFCPAGFGAQGLWKSTDGGVTWKNTLAGATVFDDYSPYGPVDVYGITVLPDDPPNHILFTYHYGFVSPDAPQVSDGGFGESTDGGKTWTVHPPPVGIGNSHYLVGVDAKTWLAIAQYNGGKNGTWRTTTAGRTQGKVSTDAWEPVDEMEHLHGAFQAYIDPTSGGIYMPVFNGTKRSLDKGETWEWVHQNSSYVSSIIGTDKFLYSNYREGPDLLRAPRNEGMPWSSYTETPPDFHGAPPLGNAASFDGAHWILVMGGHVSGIWRYVEP